MKSTVNFIIKLNDRAIINVLIIITEEMNTTN